MEYWLEWGIKLLGTCRRFSSSKETLEFVIGRIWGRRVEHNKQRMIEVLFVIEKERKLQGHSRLGDYSVASGLEVSIRHALGVRE